MSFQNINNSSGTPNSPENEWSWYSPTLEQRLRTGAGMVESADGNGDNGTLAQRTTNAAASLRNQNQAPTDLWNQNQAPTESGLNASNSHTPFQNIQNSVRDPSQDESSIHTFLSKSPLLTPPLDDTLLTPRTLNWLLQAWPPSPTNNLSAAEPITAFASQPVPSSISHSTSTYSTNNPLTTAATAPLIVAQPVLSNVSQQLSTSSTNYSTNNPLTTAATTPLIVAQPVLSNVSQQLSTSSTNYSTNNPPIAGSTTALASQPVLSSVSPQEAIFSSTNFKIPGLRLDGTKISEDMFKTLLLKAIDRKPVKAVITYARLILNSRQSLEELLKTITVPKKQDKLRLVWEAINTLQQTKNFRLSATFQQRYAQKQANNTPLQSAQALAPNSVNQQPPSSKPKAVNSGLARINSSPIDQNVAPQFVSVSLKPSSANLPAHSSAGPVPDTYLTTQSRESPILFTEQELVDNIASAGLNMPTPDAIKQCVRLVYERNVRENPFDEDLSDVNPRELQQVEDVLSDFFDRGWSGFPSHRSSNQVSTQVSTVGSKRKPSQSQLAKSTAPEEMIDLTAGDNEQQATTVNEPKKKRNKSQESVHKKSVSRPTTMNWSKWIAPMRAWLPTTTSLTKVAGDLEFFFTLDKNYQEKLPAHRLPALVAILYIKQSNPTLQTFAHLLELPIVQNAILDGSLLKAAEELPYGVRFEPMALLTLLQKNMLQPVGQL